MPAWHCQGLMKKLDVIIIFDLTWLNWSFNGTNCAQYVILVHVKLSISESIPIKIPNDKILIEAGERKENLQEFTRDQVSIPY